MAGKPILHYSNDRGRMESIRWLLAAAGVEVGSSELVFKMDLNFCCQHCSDKLGRHATVMSRRH